MEASLILEETSVSILVQRMISSLFILPPLISAVIIFACCIDVILELILTAGFCQTASRQTSVCKKSRKQYPSSISPSCLSLNRVRTECLTPPAPSSEHACKCGIQQSNRTDDAPTDCSAIDGAAIGVSTNPSWNSTQSAYQFSETKV